MHHETTWRFGVIFTWLWRLFWVHIEAMQGLDRILYGLHRVFISSA